MNIQRSYLDIIKFNQEICEFDKEDITRAYKIYMANMIHNLSVKILIYDTLNKIQETGSTSELLRKLDCYKSKLILMKNIRLEYEDTESCD